jgi:5-methylcytosine-specific restriction endonuclease McrA
MSGVLSERALVLNRNWVPIRTATVKDALCLIWKGAARAVQTDTYETHDFRSWAELGAERDKPHIRTVTLTIRVPEVIVLTRYAGYPTQSIVFSRRNLFKRDRHTCQYCGKQPGSENLTIDHVVPRSQGGRSSWTNCVLACVDCNVRKADRTPRQAGMRLLQEPCRPKWSPSITVVVGRRKESWDQFVSRMYWDAELQP